MAENSSALMEDTQPDSQKRKQWKALKSWFGEMGEGLGKGRLIGFYVVG